MTITIIDVDEEAPSIDPIKNVIYPLNATITPIILSGSDNNGITKWEVKDLPARLGFDEATHSITGTLAAPAGNYEITVIAFDADGNKAEKKFTLTIQAQPQPQPQPGYSGGGGSFSLRRDTCPNGDYSASYYDGSCGTQQNEKKPDSSDKAQTPTGEKKAYQENELFNPNIEDGKCYTRRPHLGILTSQLIPTTEEYNKAQSFLWSYEMTKYDSVDGYDPYRYLSRQEAAKIFSNFAINVLCRQPNKKLTVNYSDTQDADPSLKPYIELAYQLGIMKGSGQGDGSFRPYEFISKAEVNAVLIRMLLKSYLDETGLLRYTPYNQASHALNIISQEAGLEPIARNHVALMLFRAYKQQSFDWQEIDYFSYVLKNRADFVK